MSIAAIADALVTALISAGFSEAERKPLPYVKREDCAARRCVVICRNIVRDEGTRPDFDEVCELSIVLQQAVDDPHSNSFVDALLANVETLAALWGDAGALRHTMLQGAIYDGGPSHPTGTLYEFQQLLELHLFTSVTLVKYRIEA